MLITTLPSVAQAPPGLALDAPPRHICAMLAPTGTSNDPPVAVERLVKAYKAVTAVDGISFALTPKSCTALLGGNRRR